MNAGFVVFTMVMSNFFLYKNISLTKAFVHLFDAYIEKYQNKLFLVFKHF